MSELPFRRTRFDPDCHDLTGARRYFEHRARQLLAEDFVACAGVDELETQGVPWGARAWVERASERFASVYVYVQARGRGHMRRFVAEGGPPMVTTPDCEIEAALEQVGATFIVAGHHTLTPEYKAIEHHYGDRCARRSGAALMNHIDEGVALLRWLGAGNQAERAFCLHPLVQGDAELAAADISTLTEDVHVMALAIEYRHTANAYLSPMGMRRPDDIRLSPLGAVNDMLRADKVQNYADFLRFHKATHPRSEALDDYFRSWLTRLDISSMRFDELRARLLIPGAKT